MTAYWVGSLGKLNGLKNILVLREKIDKTPMATRKGSMMGFAFVPGIGDVIMVALGFMRANFGKLRFYDHRQILIHCRCFGTEQILLFF